MQNSVFNQGSAGRSAFEGRPNRRVWPAGLRGWSQWTRPPCLHPLHCTYSTLHKGSQVVNITSDFFSSVNVTMRHYWSDNAQFLYFSQSNATLSHEHRHHGLSSWIGIMDCHQQCHNGLSSWIFNDNLSSWIVLMDGETYLVQTKVALNFYYTINALQCSWEQLIQFRKPRQLVQKNLFRS